MMIIEARFFLKGFFTSIFCSFIFFSSGITINSKNDSANFKHPTGLYLAFAGTYSSIDVYKNYLKNPYRIGYSPRWCWEITNTFRLSGETTFLPGFNYLTSWQNLRAINLELNLQFMARIKDQNSIFYAALGLCRHTWRGDFLAQSVYYDETVEFKPGSTISKSWVGLNTGVGVERAFKYFEIFAEYRYRFSKVDDAIAVSDVAVCIGVKRKLPIKKIFRGLNDRYSWF